MCERNSTCKTQKPATTLRRSPRLLQQDLPNKDDDPRTPQPEPRRTGGSHSILTPLSSVRKGSLNKSQKQRRGEVAEKAKETRVCRNLSTHHQRSVILDGGVKPHCRRRSPRFSGNCNVEGVVFEESKKEDLSKMERFPDSGRKSDCRIGRRVTRSSIRGNNEEGNIGSGNVVIGSVAGKTVNFQNRSDKEKVKDGASSSEQCLYRIEKRVTRSSSRRAERENIQKCGNFKVDKPIQHASFQCLNQGMLSQDGNFKIEIKLSEQCIRKPVNTRKCRTSSSDSSRGGDRKGFTNEVGNNLAGTKRKRVEANESHRTVQGWTREQELALQRAYFAAKPTPHFWKKVSKMVPGKSAQECFDKIHSSHLTPPQPQPRSRAKGTKSSSLSFSASELLTSSEPKHKKGRKSKQKSFLSHKAVRDLLQRQCKIDQDNEADLFAVLESSLNPSIRITAEGSLSSTPECDKKGSGFLKRCLESSSSARRKHLSCLNATCGGTLTSPPVLKQVKNKALHERYIDQLHTREAKRKAASLRATNCSQRKDDAIPNNAQKREAVKAAKDALIFEAREALDQFHHLQNSITNNDADYDDFADIAEDDIEDGC